MKNMIALLAATAAISFTAHAYAADATTESQTKVEYKKNGGYESSSSSESSDKNTTATTDSKVDVDVDSRGNVKKTLETTETADPKGLLNKKVNDSKTVFEEKSNGGYKQTTTRDHTDKNGTNTSLKTVTDVDVDSVGNVTTNAKTEKTVDPKGLLNSKTSVSTTKSVNGQVVEHKQKQD